MFFVLFSKKMTLTTESCFIPESAGMQNSIFPVVRVCERDNWMIHIRCFCVSVWRQGLGSMRRLTWWVWGWRRPSQKIWQSRLLVSCSYSSGGYRSSTCWWRSCSADWRLLWSRRRSTCRAWEQPWPTSGPWSALPVDDPQPSDHSCMCASSGSVPSLARCWSNWWWVWWGQLSSRAEVPLVSWRCADSASPSLGRWTRRLLRGTSSASLSAQMMLAMTWMSRTWKQLTSMWLRYRALQ